RCPGIRSRRGPGRRPRAAAGPCLPGGELVLGHVDDSSRRAHHPQLRPLPAKGSAAGGSSAWIGRLSPAAAASLMGEGTSAGGPPTRVEVIFWRPISPVAGWLKNLSP